MTREQKLESMLMTLFTLAPNVKQKDWDEIYEQYKNLSTIVQQPLSGSDRVPSSPKSASQTSDNGKRCRTFEEE
jgi:hypothetical protein